MKYEKPNLEEMDLILEGSFLSDSTDMGLGGAGNDKTPWD